MDSIKLWARNGEAVRQAIELGDLVHLETASEELTDFFHGRLGSVMTRRCSPTDYIQHELNGSLWRCSVAVVV